MVLRTLLLVSVSFCISVLPLLAQSPSADLRVDVLAPFEVPVGEVDWLVRVANEGPDAASNVQVVSGLYRDGILIEPRCTSEISSLEPGSHHEVRCSAPASAIPPYNWTIQATVDSATHDPVERDNSTGTVVRIITTPDLTVWATTGFVDPGLPFELNLKAYNHSYSTAMGVEIVVDVPRSEGFLDLPEGCKAIDETSVRCEIGTISAATDPHIPHWGEASLTLFVFAPDDPTGSTLAVTSTISSDQEDPYPANNVATLDAVMFRTFYVTRTDDSGPGSLRSAIEEAGAECNAGGPCKIAFRIEPSGAEQWHTIAPLSPLPPITGSSVRIDGTTQTRFFWDANSSGPEIEINGHNAGPLANGLVLSTSCVGELTGLTVNGFDGIGVIGAGTADCASNPTRLEGALRRIRDSYIGTDPTGMTAAPNRRGIVIDYGEPVFFALPGQTYYITGNLISGNERSGIVSVVGTYLIANNIIGLNGDVSAGLGNGASGVYIAPDSHGTDLVGNYIGFNRHFGIAIAAEASYVAVHGNSIQANWQGAIDIGLDGVTPVLGPFSNQPEDVLKLPVITNAFWDASRGVTVIEGLVPDLPMTIGTNTVNLYANDQPDPSGYGEGQYHLGESVIEADDTFRLEIEGDWRSKWVAATATRRHYIGFAKPVTGSATDHGFLSVTTEFGIAVQVH